MFSFEGFLDLPLIWYGLIGTALFLYVLLDGFDLGLGILFPFAPSEKCRDRMMNSIAPFWDGNETWLVLGGGGLFAAFPLAYAILMPAFYIPIILMLLGLLQPGSCFFFQAARLHPHPSTSRRLFRSTSDCSGFTKKLREIFCGAPPPSGGFPGWKPWSGVP